MREEDEYHGWKKWQYYSLYCMAWTVIYIILFRVAEEIDRSWSPPPRKATLLSMGAALWMMINDMANIELVKMKKKDNERKSDTGKGENGK